MQLVSLEKGSYVRVDQVNDIPNNGLIVYLKEFGKVRLFRQCISLDNI